MLRDSCIWKVRSQQSGVTRTLPADPLTAFLPLRGLFPLSLGTAFQQVPPLMGFTAKTNKFVFISRSTEFQRTQR